MVFESQAAMISASEESDQQILEAIIEKTSKMKLITKYYALVKCEYSKEMKLYPLINTILYH